MVRLSILLAAVAALLLAASPASADLVRKSATGPITFDSTGTPPVQGSPYPSTIYLSGRTDVVTGVTVKLNKLSHSFPDDLDLMLTGPNGARVMLMSDAGGGEDVDGIDVTFDDTAPAELPDTTGPLTTGTYRPTNHDSGTDTFNGSAPVPPYGPSLTDAFAGSDPNGGWRLYAIDDSLNDGGQIAGGWTLTLRTGRRGATTEPITIQDGTPPTQAAPYSSNIDIAGALGAIDKVTVRLSGVSHGDPGDIDVLLQSPDYIRTTLLSDAGGTGDTTGADLLFDDDAPTGLSASGGLPSGRFKPTDIDQGADSWPSPAPPPSGTSSLDVFDGTSPNGTWRLWVVDDGSGAAGKIDGWSLNVTLKSGVRLEAGSVINTEADGTKTLVVERPEGGGAATVHYELPGPHYVHDVKPASGSLSFVIGQKKKNLPVTFIDDAGDEPTEYPSVRLTAVSGDVVTQEGGTNAPFQLQDDDRTDARDDFNGDGYADQAIGVPDEDLPGGADAGAVQVLYGSSDSGLTATGDQRFTQDVTGVPDVAEPGDRFGAAVAASDFDGDGFGDLAIGAPGEDDGGVADMGRVTILHGSATGLKTSGALLLGQGSPNVPDDNEPGDRFGAALAAGNLGRGDRGDLAVGAPGEDVGAINGAGAVTTLYGTASGLGTAGSTLWTQNTANVEQDAEAGDGFGSVLAIGDFGKGAESDLAVGVPAENSGGGIVQILYGTTATGIAAAGDKLFSQSTPGMVMGGAQEAGDHFGAALAAGQIGGFGEAEDLAIGVPDENLDGIADTGFVHVLRGDAGAGLTLGDVDAYSQGDGDIATGNGAGDRFGAAVAIGDFGGSEFPVKRAAAGGAGVVGGDFGGYPDDLAIGVPGESFGAVKGAGAVEIVYGRDAPSPGIPSNTQLDQDDADVADTNEAGDHFGAALARGAYRGPSDEDGLSVGVPGEKVGAAGGAGALATFYAGSYGLSDYGGQRWTQGSDGLLDAAETGDAFGEVLAP